MKVQLSDLLPKLRIKSMCIFKLHTLPMAQIPIIGCNWAVLTQFDKDNELVDEKRADLNNNGLTTVLPEQLATEQTSTAKPLRKQLSSVIS